MGWCGGPMRPVPVDGSIGRMGAVAATAKAPLEDAAKGPAGGGRRKLVILAVPVVLLAVLAGLWFGGILPPLLGMGRSDGAGEAAGAKPDAKAAAAGAKPEGAKPEGAKPEGGHGGKTPTGLATKSDGGQGAKAAAPAPPGKAEPGAVAAPIFTELPDIVTNLNAGGRRTVYVKLRVRLELARPEDAAAVTAAMPRLLDLFQTYLREMRPEELRGSAGTYRLREELLARTNIAVAPVRVQDLLFAEMLIQ